MPSKFKAAFKKAVPIIIFDVVAFTTISLAFAFGSKGPCNGGLEGALAFMVTAPIGALFLFYYIFMGVVKHQKDNFIIALIHFLAWGTFVSIGFFV